jgi:hypothetical protein
MGKWLRRQGVAIASFVLGWNALITACQHSPSGPSDVHQASVGPVALAALARIIHDEPKLKRLSRIDAGYGDPALPVVPFTIIVAALALPSEGHSVQCTWTDRTVTSYRVVYASARAAEAAEAEEGTLRDAGLREVDMEWWEEKKVGPDPDRPLVSVRFDDQLRASSAPLHKDSDSRRTYWATFLCGDGDRAAILVEYADEMLDGLGLLIVLRQSHDHWELVETRGRWIA